jgi:hypothetical protein
VKGVRFYLDYSTKQRKRKGQHAGNVIAAHVEASGRSWSHVGYLEHTVLDGEMRSQFIVECITALHDEPNSSVCSSSVAQSYLADSCKMISEDKARDIHPKLFERLDMED